LSRLFRTWPDLVKLFGDGGYKAGLIRWAQAMFGYVLEVVQRGAEQGFKPLAKRWIVERSFAWLLFQRRFSKDYEHNPNTSETMLYIAFSTLMLRRLHPL
jgi:transposase